MKKLLKPKILPTQWGIDSEEEEKGHPDCCFEAFSNEAIFLNSLASQERGRVRFPS